MAMFRSKLSIVTVLLAASAMTAAPLAAAELPLPAASPRAYDSHANDAFGHRRWRRHHDGVDAGDVIAGVAVIGVLAAIAGAASDNRREERVVYRDRPEPYREPYRDYGRESRGWNSGGIDSAVDECVNQVERGNDRVVSVDSAARDASGWQVQGTLDTGSFFSCRLDNEGRIRAIDLGDDFAAIESAAPQSPPQPQLSDEAYAQARAATRNSPPEGTVDADLDGPLPAYPGGPLPGEEGYEDSFGG